MRILALVLLSVATLAGAPGALAAEYYVRTSGNDGADGLTPATAFRTIQRAVARSTGSGNIIRVGPGNYNEEVFIGLGAGTSAGNGTAAQPNRIIGDPAGVATGDPAGPVVINGGNARTYGMRIQNRSHWEVSYLTFSNQRTYSTYLYRANQLRFEGCTFNVAPYYGMYVYDAADPEIVDNVFSRARSSGHCIMIFQGRGQVLVSGNRMNVTGPLYLSGNFATSTGGWGNPVRNPYGIYVYNRDGVSSRIRVENNVGSDLFLGIYVVTYRNGQASVANNSVSGCYYGIYGYAYRGRVNLRDNIVANARYGALVYGRGQPAEVSGILTFNTWRPVHRWGNTSVSGDLIGDPQWNDPAAGDFSLASSSPAIDAGSGGAGVGHDILGAARPVDGNGDSIAVNDLGAWEYTGATTSPIIVQWSEREPD